jgi:hypothetical protein
VASADAPTHGLKVPGYIADREKVITPLWEDFIEMDSYDSITNQMLLMEKYELAMGIQPKDNASPISLVTMNEGTDLFTDNLLERTYNKLIRSKAVEITGLNLKELLNLPTYDLQMLLRCITIARQDEQPALTKVEKQLKNINKGKKQ